MILAALGQRDQAGNVIGMFVGNEDGIERRDIFADGSQALGDFAAAEAGIDQNAGAVRRDKNRVARTAAGEDANF
jgi:hypothetical protein